MRQLFAAAGIALTLAAGPYLNSVTAVTAQPVIVRAGPGLDYARVGRLDAGQVLAVLARSGSHDNWLRVRGTGEAPGPEGWIAHFTVSPLGNTSELPLIDPPATTVPTPANRRNVQVRVFRSVNVRSGPTIEADILTQLRSGDRLRVLGRSGTDNDWLFVDLEGITGWLAYFTVTAVGDLRAVPVVDPDTGTPITPTPIPVGVQAAAFRTVNVRGGPGVEFDLLGQLFTGDVVPVTGRSDNGNNWLQIDFDDQSGWVAYFTVSVSGNPDTLPIIE